MDLSWLQTLLYGAFMGNTEILPVSSRAHSAILLKVFGKTGADALPRLLIHASVLIAIYYASHPHIVRVMRARSLARVPKKRRKRPLDTKSLMDYSLWKTTLIPVIAGYLLYDKTAVLDGKLIAISAFLFLNGVILYVPQFLPGCNKDSRMLTRFDGLLMGLGGALSILPGISGIGAAISVGSFRGVDRTYALNVALLMNGVVMVCLMVMDVLALMAVGLSGLTFLDICKGLLSAAAAFVGATLGIRLMRMLIGNSGFYLFSYYCWGLALFTFILNLMA